MEVRSYDSFDAALQAIATARDEANARLHPKQRALTWGSRFVCFYPSEGLVVFGHCLTEQEASDGERAAGADDHELAASAERLRVMQADGYLFSRCHSIVEPDGELGDVHQFSAWPISAELYDAAELAHFDPSRLGTTSMVELGHAYAAYRDHRLEVG